MNLEWFPLNYDSYDISRWFEGFATCKTSGRVVGYVYIKLGVAHENAHGVDLNDRISVDGAEYVRYYRTLPNSPGSRGFSVHEDS